MSSFLIAGLKIRCKTASPLRTMLLRAGVLPLLSYKTESPVFYSVVRKGYEKIIGSPSDM